MNIASGWVGLAPKLRASFHPSLAFLEAGRSPEAGGLLAHSPPSHQPLFLLVTFAVQFLHAKKLPVIILLKFMEIGIHGLPAQCNASFRNLTDTQKRKHRGAWRGSGSLQKEGDSELWSPAVTV